MNQTCYLAAAAAGKEGGMYQSLIMIGIFIVFSYFILYRPEQKRKKRLQSLRQNLKKGDRVVAMGIRATVDEVREKTVILTHVDGSKMEMVSAAITEVESPSPDISPEKG